MLKSRTAQAGVMVGVMGLIFGMALYPIPNLASEYILGSVISDMEFHYDRHQAAFESYKTVNSGYGPNFLVSEWRVASAVDNPEECENNQGDFIQFERSILDNHNCVETPDTTYSYGYYGTGGAAYTPDTTDSPPRISFYVREEDQNSMYMELNSDE